MIRLLDSSPQRSATLTGAGPNPKVLCAQGMLPTDESSSLGPNRWLALERRPVIWATAGVPHPVTGTLPLGRQGRAVVEPASIAKAAVGRAPGEAQSIQTRPPRFRRSMTMGVRDAERRDPRPGNGSTSGDLGGSLDHAGMILEV
jgi:hypothetical protein